MGILFGRDSHLGGIKTCDKRILIKQETAPKYHYGTEIGSAFIETAILATNPEKNFMVSIPATDAELLAACDVDTFCAGGKGGQHANRTETAVRLTHRTTGTSVVCRRERSQFLNKQEALRLLRIRLEALNRVAKKRYATKAPLRVKREISEGKQHRSRVKALRRRPSIDRD